MKKLLIPSIAAVDKGEETYRGDEDRFNQMKIIFGINAVLCDDKKKYVAITTASQNVGINIFYISYLFRMSS